MPRNRSARVAVLGSVQRAASAPYSSRVASARKRRVVAGVLVVLSLAMITVYFRESGSGGLHDAQAVGASVLRPFQVGAERVARPFRDVYGYFAGLVHAKSENARLRVEVDRLRQQVIQSRTALEENERLRGLLEYRTGPTYPRDYRPVSAAVIARAPSQFDQQIVISAGSSDGIRLHDPVVTRDGLVGHVTKLTSGTAQVTLLTDKTSAVSAVDLFGGAFGLIRHGQAKGNALILDRVKKEQVVAVEHVVVTSGTQEGGLASLYPKGIPIGVVTSVGQTDTDLYKQIQVRPFVDFSALHAVIVLVSQKKPPKVP